MSTQSSPLIEACFSVPHVVEEIFYFCTPAAYDAARLACKTLHRLSMNRRVLRDKVLTLAAYSDHMKTFRRLEKDDLQYISICETKSVHQLLLEFLTRIQKRQSTWRIPRRKTVIELGQCQSSKNVITTEPEWISAVNLVIGTSRGEYLGVVWNDSGDEPGTSMSIYRFLDSPSESVKYLTNPESFGVYGKILRTPKEILMDQTAFKECCGSHINLDSTHCHKDGSPRLKFYEDFTIDLIEGMYKVPHATRMTAHPYRPPDKSKCSVTLHVSCIPKSQARKRWTPPTSPSYTFEAYSSMNNPPQPEASGKYFEQIEETFDAYNLNYKRLDCFYTAKRYTDLYLDQAAEQTLHFNIMPNGVCHAVGYADSQIASTDRTWCVYLPSYRAGQSYNYGSFHDIEVHFTRQDTVSSSQSRVEPQIPPRCATSNLCVTGVLKQAKAAACLASFIAKDEFPEYTLDNEASDHGYTISLILPSFDINYDDASIIMASPSPAFFFKKLLPMDELRQLTPSELVRYSTVPTTFSVDQEVIEADMALRVVGVDNRDRLWLWEVTEQDILIAGLTKQHCVTGKLFEKISNVKGIATINHIFGQRIFVLTYGPCNNVHNPGKGIDSQLESGTLNTSNDDEDKQKEEQDRWRLVTYDLENPFLANSSVRMDREGKITKLW